MIFEANESNNSTLELRKLKLNSNCHEINHHHQQQQQPHQNNNNINLNNSSVHHSINSQNYNNKIESNSTSISKPQLPRDTIRISLVLITSLISTLVPNVGMLVSLAGASSGAALSLIFPPVVDLVLYIWMKESRTYGELIVDILSIVLGILAAIFGTISSLQDIWTSFSVQ